MDLSGEGPKEDIKIVKQTEENLKGELERSQRNNEQANADLERLRRDNDQANADLERLRRDNDRPKQDIKIFKQTEEERNSDLESFQRDLEQANAHLERLRIDNDQRKAEFKRPQRKNERLKQVMKIFKKTEEGPKEDIKIFKQTEEERKAEFKRRQRKNERPKQDIKIFKQTEEGLKVEFERYQSNIEHLKGELERSQRNNEHLKGELERSQRNNEHLKGELERSQRNNEHLKGELERSQRNNEHLKGELERSQRNNEQLKGELERSQRNNEHATELDRYEMEQGSRGICLVINNYNIPGGRERQGAEIDENKIVDLFRDELDFEVKVLHNLLGSEILKTAKEFAARDLTQFTEFVFIIMSHGDKDAIEGVDGALVKVAPLMSLFSVTECPTLRNKPKLFFIEACRGQRSDPRKDRLPTPLSNTKGDGIAMMLCPDSALAHGVTPLEADFLLSFATVPGYEAYRSQVAGSWYIQVLADVIRKYHRHNHLLDMLTEVNKQVAAIANDYPEHDLSFQVPAQSNTLRAKVFL